MTLRRLSSLIKTLSFSEPAIFYKGVLKIVRIFLCLNLYIHDVVEPVHRSMIKEHVEVCPPNFNKLYHYTTSATELRHNSFQLYAWRLFLSFFLIRGSTRFLRMPALRPASQAGPMRNPRERLATHGTAVFSKCGFCVWLHPRCKYIKK